MIFISIVTQDISYLYELQISGLAGFISAVLVVFKQTLPEHQVHFFRSLISVRVKHLPVLYISTVTIGFLLKSMTVLDPTTMLLSVFGLLVSWAYLRFYQTQDGVRGDRSEAFAFTTFFPEQLQ